MILLGFLYETLKIGPDASGAAAGFIPHLQGTDSLLLAVGIIGATVMPHVIYLHSALTQDRIRPANDSERKELVRIQRIDVMVALTIAGLVNMAMLAVIASLLHGTNIPDADTIAGAYQNDPEESHTRIPRGSGNLSASRSTQSSRQSVARSWLGKLH